MMNKSAVLAENGGVFYEGDDFQLWAINPTPVISVATFQPQLTPARDSGVTFNALLFREDYFDATTRIRRGRFYGTDATGHFREWNFNRVSTWPRAPLPAAPGGMAQMHSIHRRIKIEPISLPRFRSTVVTLGAAGYESDWQVIDVELTINDELFFTLKPMFPLGILPRLTSTNSEIISAYDEVIEASLKARPTPIVDVCRNSAFVVLHAVYGEAREMADLIKKIPPGQVMIISAAKLLNRLHPRGKAAEQLRFSVEGKPLRPIIDEDATLAVKLFGLLLVELNLAVY